MKILIDCMQGIGDSIYARPFVKMLVADGHEVFMQTPLPFIYGDLNVKFIKPEKLWLRTQTKSFNSTAFEIVEKPEKLDKTIKFFYSDRDILRHGIVTHMEEAFGYEPGSTIPEFDLPTNLSPHGVSLPKNKKIAIVRPVTHRSEWLCTSRSPQPVYVVWCARILYDMGYHVISVADCESGKEWIEPDGDTETVAHQLFHKGELSIEQTLSLMKDADLVVGGSGFIIPAAVASKTNLFVLFGGRGRYDNPHKLFDFRMDLTKIGWALPTNFCRCKFMQHNCNKEIKDLDSQFMKAVAQFDLNKKYEQLCSNFNETS